MEQNLTEKECTTPKKFESYIYMERNGTAQDELESTDIIYYHYILFFGSAVSILCLVVALSLQLHFKRLWSNKVTVQGHLMVVILIRSALLLFYEISLVFNLFTSSNDIFAVLTCNVAPFANLFSTVSSINWMLLQGVYFHRMLTKMIRVDGVAPLVLTILFAAITKVYHHPIMCWQEKWNGSEIWILGGPCIVTICISFCFRICIIRILLNLTHQSFREAISSSRPFSTIFILPVMEISNAIYLFEPGLRRNKWLIWNSVFGSIQGAVISTMYCYLTQDMIDAVRDSFPTTSK